MTPFQRFALKAVALGFPLALSAGVYFSRDPFRVLRHYDFGDYYDEFAPVQVNRDYASLQILWARYAEERYDSFILGSSRSEPFRCEVWRAYIGGDAAHPFHWPAASENVLGMAKKVEYLDARGVRIAHALIEMSYVTFGDLNARTDPTHRLPYEVSGESWFDFQAADFASFFSDFYFVKYTDYALTGVVRPYARSALAIRRGDFHVSPRTNDFYFAHWDRELDENEGAYYARHASAFPPTAAGQIPCRESLLRDAQLHQMQGMQRIFEKHHTDYRIVIPPFMDQVCVNRTDLEAIRRVFGAGRVYDYSGQNDITRNEHNFYDETHLRPAAASQILHEIYTQAR